MENKKTNTTTNNKRYLEEALQKAKEHIKKDTINGYAYAFGMLNSAILSFLGKEDELRQELGLNNKYFISPNPNGYGTYSNKGNHRLQATFTYREDALEWCKQKDPKGNY